MADKQAQIGAAANQEDVQHICDSTKAAIRCATRTGEISHERIHHVYGMKVEKLDHREESKLSKNEQMMIGHLRSGHHPEL